MWSKTTALATAFVAWICYNAKLQRLSIIYHRFGLTSSLLGASIFNSHAVISLCFLKRCSALFCCTNFESVGFWPRCCVSYSEIACQQSSMQFTSNISPFPSKPFENKGFKSPLHTNLLVSFNFLTPVARDCMHTDIVENKRILP